MIDHSHPILLQHLTQNIPRFPVICLLQIYKVHVNCVLLDSLQDSCKSKEQVQVVPLVHCSMTSMVSTLILSFRASTKDNCLSEFQVDSVFCFFFASIMYFFLNHCSLIFFFLSFFLHKVMVGLDTWFINASHLNITCILMLSWDGIQRDKITLQ